MFGIFIYSANLAANNRFDNFWFSVKYIIVVSILIYFLWIFSKFVTKKNYIGLKDRRIKVLERLALSNDKFLLLVELENIFYFMGIDKNGMYLMDKREDLKIEDYLKDSEVDQNKFIEFLQASLAKKEKNDDQR